MTTKESSVTGALHSYLTYEVPAWIPHKSVTTEEAVNCVITHMECDSIDPRWPAFDSDNRMRNEFNGNFFICSAGFHIVNPDADQRARLLNAWIRHQDSPQWKLANQLIDIGKRQDSEIEALPRPSNNGDWRTYDSRKDKYDRLVNGIRAKYREIWKPLENELDSIYRSKRQALVKEYANDK